MKKLVVLFVAITFLATFTLIGCNQSQQPPNQQRRRERLEHLEHLEQLEHLEHLRQHRRRESLEHLEHPERRGAWSTWSTSTRKIVDAGYRGISSPRGYTLSLWRREWIMKLKHSRAAFLPSTRFESP